MKDRSITFIGALLSALVVIMLIVPPTDPSNAKISKPTSTNRGEFGLMGLKTWADENQILTLSLRNRFDTFVSDKTIPANGNLLITSSPYSVARESDETEALINWLNEGNYILVLAAIDDRPEWSWNQNISSADYLDELGFRFNEEEVESEYRDETAIVDNDENEDESIDFAQAIREMRSITGERESKFFTPALSHPVLENIANIQTSHQSRWVEQDTTLKGIDETRFALPLLREEGEKQNVFWEVRNGAGGAWVSSYPDLFGNVTLGKADNARLFANIVNASLGSGGAIIFEDFRFGLSELYNPDAFFADRRLHNTLLFLGVLWIVYALGRTNRLAPVVEPERKSHVADFVGAMAGLHARRSDRRSIRQGLLKQFFNRVRQRYNLPRNGEPVWDILDKNASVAKNELNRLRELAEKTGRFSNRELQKLSSRIQHLQSKLS
ncbi:MAG: hypothetical protein OER96_06365 [Gammaproteobacteria bacterium]|nr:hypothetical protein [Gammaproteobacteria bacterium]